MPATMESSGASIPVLQCRGVGVNPDISHKCVDKIHGKLDTDLATMEGDSSSVGRRICGGEGHAAKNRLLGEKLDSPEIEVDNTSCSVVGELVAAAWQPRTDEEKVREAVGKGANSGDKERTTGMRSPSSNTLVEFRQTNSKRKE